MSQNPVLPEENTEEIKITRPRRTRKAAAEDAQASAEKKPARRTRKSAPEQAEEGAPVESTEEKKPRRRAVKKAAEEDSAQTQEKPVRRTRSRKKTADIVAPADGEAEDIIHLGSALVLDDMLPPSSMTADTEEKPAPAEKRRTGKTVKAEKPSSPEKAASEAPAEKKVRRTRKTVKQDVSEAPVEEDLIIHLGSALVLDDMLPPSSATPEQEEEQPAGKKRRQRRPVKERAGDENVAPQTEDTEEKTVSTTDTPSEDDNIGNKAQPSIEAVSDAQPWQDDGIVTNILPYPGEFDDTRSHQRSRRNRKNRDAQPAFNGSPYLPSSYQQNFYDQPQALVTDSPFGNRKNRRNRKSRNQGVPAIPDDFDFNAAMLNDSVLGVALGRREEEFLPEEDGPQPALPGQPVALPLSSGDMAEEDLAALDAAVNGNRIDAPTPATQKEGRGKGRNKKQPKEEKPARTEKKVETEEAVHARRVLYVSVVPDEQVEVVITEDGQVTEYFVEMAHQVKIRGNIYKGIINNIDTNLQAAFVNFGNGKNGFLQIDEVHPEYYLVPHDATHGPKYPPIQKVLKVGQEVLVQVVKEPSGTKGAFLTTWISIAGRFLVLTPGQEQIGVSRKVEDPEERARLKDLLNGIQPGENMGVIIRTASEGASKASIQQDLQYLKKLWKDIQKKAPAEKSPCLIYQEADLATRSVRDYLSDDIVEIWTDDEATKARVEDIAGLIFPDRAGDIVKLHKDQRQSLWERFNLLRQLETVTSREVVLPSGGRLVFDQTEALMAIDINSGKTQGKTNFEAMVFRTNMEAAEAIARHLRLRDIGGQVVIDFIEMRDKNHCREVERTLKNAMRKDRARHDVGHMSSFGLLELVRQRTGTSAISISCEPCPHCHGTGVRRNMEWQALQALRDLQSKLCKSLDSDKGKKNEKSSETSTFTYESDAELALYLLNRKRDRIAALEEKYGTHIEIRLK